MLITIELMIRIKWNSNKYLSIWYLNRILSKDFTSWLFLDHPFYIFAKSYIFHRNHQISLRRWLFLNHWSDIDNFLWNEILSLRWILPYDLFLAMRLISKVIKLSTRFFYLFLEIKILKTRFRRDKMIPIPQAARLKLLLSIQIGRYQ